MKKIVPFLIFAFSLPALGQQHVTYDSPVTLTGRVEMLSANDMQLGKDVPVKYPALILDAPITADSDASVQDEQPATTGVVQLVTMSQLDYSTVKHAVGRRTAIECHDLFSAISAHHFTPILCTVQRVITP